MGAGSIYDGIGESYAQTRRPDRRIAQQIHAALGDVSSVLNVGAGAGSYEPASTVLAVEPSALMVAQRPIGSAMAVRGIAEALPVADGAVDAVMALLTMHHWHDVDAGVAELRRVARRRVVILTWDQQVTRDFWFVRDYVPRSADLDDSRAIPMDRLAAMLGGARVEPVLVPHDCTDGFGAAFWRRPERYLEPAIRRGMSMLAQLDPADVLPGIERLRADLDSGEWAEMYGDLLTRNEFDAGYRLVIA